MKDPVNGKFIKTGGFVKCSFCKTDIWRTPCSFKYSKSKRFFCDKLCRDKYFAILRTGIPRSEETKEKIRAKRVLQVIPKSSYKKMGLKMRGTNHWNWKGGRHINGDGYYMLYKPDHPKANRHGYMKEHRLVVEEHLGRLLRKEETPHHINEIKTDNRISNLYLFPTNKEHRIYHIRLRFGKVLPITKSNL